MSDDRSALAAAFVALTALTVVICAGLYGCQKANEHYYGFATDCVRAGGSWVPQGSSWNAICVRGSAKSEP